jgi:hypothetical protein
VATFGLEHGQGGDQDDQHRRGDHVQGQAAAGPGDGVAIEHAEGIEQA